MKDEVRVLCEENDEALTDSARGSEDTDFEFLAVLRTVHVYRAQYEPEKSGRGGGGGVVHTSQSEEI